MKYIFGQDKQIRTAFKNFEIQQKIIKSLCLNTKLPLLVRRKLHWQLSKIGIFSSFVFVKNYCVLSGRAASVYSFFNLSRLIIKKLYKLGRLPGLQKSSW